MIVKQKKIHKPWGYEVIWAHCDKYIGKKIFIKNNHSLSRQYHVFKEETIIVNFGSLLLEIGCKEYKKKCSYCKKWF